MSPEQARSVYNRIGRIQDRQSFYESAAIDDMITHADFAHAGSVFEFGCGTGELARRLLTDHLPREAGYRGIDISDTMVGLATERLARWSDRVEVERVSGGLPLSGADGGFDRFVATYVFDLLDTDTALDVLDEAHRLLTSGGLLCVVSLTEGPTRISGAMSSTWRWIWARTPQLLGGCRPVEMRRKFSDDRWDVLHHAIVISWAVPSEVVVARAVS